MNIVQLSIMSLLLSLSLFFSGCGGNNSDTPESIEGNGITQVPTDPTDPTVPSVTGDDVNLTIVLPVSATVLTTNSQVVNIEVRVFDSFNNPYSEGTITKINPNDVLTGRDIGTFDTISAPLVNGVAKFVYTAPSKLDSDTSNITFAFYHSSDSNTRVSYTFSINPAENQTVFSNYSIVPSNGSDKTMGLKSSKNISYTIVGDDTEALSDLSIVSIVVSSLNPSLATLKDSVGNSGTELNFTNNGFSINLQTNTKSGLVPIKVEAIFKDSNGDEQSLVEVFDIVVLSGPPTAMSLSYAESLQKSEYAKFVENWVLTVTDTYNNLVNTNPSISMGALVGYATSSATTSNSREYLFYNNAIGSATLSDANPDTLTTSANAFDNVNPEYDKLVLFGGNGYRFKVFGKWDIDEIAASNKLTLLDDYNGEDVSDLGFAVGNNFRNEVCSGNPVVANVYAKDGNNVLGSDGSMIIQVEYDYYLVGKDIILWSNLVGSDNRKDGRIGIARKVTLRGQGLESPVFEVSSGYNGIISLPVNISGTSEDYKNGHFDYSIAASPGIVVNSIVGSSMDNIYECGFVTNDALGKDNIHYGRAYVDVDITATINGTIQLKNINPKNEF